jgi:hypothetical protein
VAAVGLLNHVHGKKAQRVDALLVKRVGHEVPCEDLWGKGLQNDAPPPLASFRKAGMGLALHSANRRLERQTACPLSQRSCSLPASRLHGGSTCFDFQKKA